MGSVVADTTSPRTTRAGPVPESSEPRVRRVSAGGRVHLTWRGGRARYRHVASLPKNGGGTCVDGRHVTQYAWDTRHGAWLVPQ